MNTNLFNSVVNSKIETLKNEITNKAEAYAQINKTELLTEEETRQRAVNFVYRQLARELDMFLMNKT